MNLHDHKTKLRYAAQKLLLRWDETRPQWNDAVSRDFERAHLVPLEAPLSQALRAIESLSEVLSRAEQDCRE
ncbi:MAG: hypothetical protein JNG90_17130 [Planctomycetaceae bacterium]|nr:hypothetical protein [Planctomycetaceae bacterium]